MGLFTTLILMVMCFLWGAFTVRNRIFPYRILRRLSEISHGVFKVDNEMSPEKPAASQDASISYDALFVGDSLTYGGNWAAFFPEKRIYNAAVMGETTRGAMRYVDSVTRLGAKRAFIMLGAKDFESVGYRCATAEDLDETLRNIKTIFSTITFYGADVVMLEHRS
jgi:hypothetical protein